MNHCSVCAHKHKKDCIWNCGCEAFELDLAAHDKQIKNEILSDVEEIILEIMYCNNKEIGKYVKVNELRSRLEELKGEQNE